MKKLILIFALFIFMLPCQSTVITGEVKYDYELAREETLKKPLTPVSFEFIRLHLIDKNREENLENIKLGITQTQNRKLATFSDGGYGVEYFDDPEFAWFYDFGGRLTSFTQKDSLIYPCRTTRYKPDGSVANVGLKISDRESFIYNTDGKLIAHWLGEVCFDEMNNVVMKREYKN